MTPAPQAPEKLTLVFEPCEEGGFHVFIAERPGIHSQGETIEEAFLNIADAYAEMGAEEEL